MRRVRRARDEDAETNLLSTEMVESPPTWSPPSAVLRSGVDGGANCILHPVSRFDTLAGVAIRYGVEVADIKRLNGLFSDLQMFALKTLQIPSPGRHPRSLSYYNGDNTANRPNSIEHTPPMRHQNDLFHSFPSLKSALLSETEVSPAMISLQDYYGTVEADKESALEGFEVTMYRDRVTHRLQGDPISSSSPLNPPFSHHRKSKSVATGLVSVNGSLHHPLLPREGECSTGTDEWIAKLLRKLKKSESDFSSCPTDKHMEGIRNGSSSSRISTSTGKGLALRPAKSSRTTTVDAELAVPSPPMVLGYTVTDTMGSVRKSSSTPSLQGADNGAFSSLWQSAKWRPDFQALSSAVIPIFDGFPKAIGKKNKTAVD